MKALHTPPPRIALVVDNPLRDLPGLVLVAWRLCQAGATCYLAPMYEQAVEVWSLVPDFVLLNYLRVNNERMARVLLRTGIQVGVLDTEGSVFSPMPPKANAVGQDAVSAEDDRQPTYEEYALTMARDAAVRHHVECYCAWTPAFARYASQAGWYRTEQIAVTGTPRVDFLAPRWREAALSLSTYADGYPTPMVLINGSFPLANPGFQTPEEEAEMMVSRFSYERQFVEKWQRTQSDALRGLTALANQLARRFPDVTFIYRPHPFEGREAYHALLEPLPNLHLVKEGTVEGWLLRATALIHWGSSTAVDAGVAGIPAFMPGWLPVHLPVPLVDSVSMSPSTPEDLIEQVGAVLSGRFMPPARLRADLEQAIEDTFYKVDGGAHERVAAAALEACRRSGARGSPRSWRYVVYVLGVGTRLRFRGAVRRALNGFAHRLPRRVRERLLTGLPSARSEKYFDAAVVRRIVSAIEAAASPSGRAVMVAEAQEVGAYRFAYRRGRAVMLCPAQAGPAGE